MTDHAVPPGFGQVHTQAARRAVAQVRDHTFLADLLYLERWEMAPVPGAAAALRVAQIRRANPQLAAEVRAEISVLQRALPMLRRAS